MFTGIKGVALKECDLLFPWHCHLISFFTFIVQQANSSWLLKSGQIIIIWINQKEYCDVHISFSLKRFE